MNLKSSAFLSVAFLLLLFFLPFSGLVAQTGSISPYSRYGIGDINPEGFSSQLGMGGIGAAVATPYNINFINPASYVADSVITFDFGANGEIRKLSITGESTTANSASFSHFSLAFPLVRGKASAAFGLLPFSSVGYNIQVDIPDAGNLGELRYLFEGKGGFNKFFVGTGIKIIPGLTAGVNASYLFGTIDNIVSVEFPNSTNYFNTRYVNALTAKGFYFSYGLMYEKMLKENLRFTAGLTGSLSTKVNAINSEYYFNYIYSNVTGGEVLKDSVFNEREVDGHIKLPQYWRGGFTIGNPNKWLAGLDFSYYNWAGFENFQSVDTLKNSYSIRAGGERNFDKFVYRAGFSYATTYINLRNTQLDEYGITFGIGIKRFLPQRPPSAINIAVELGQRGTNENNLIKEQYIKFHLGFTLTDKWFYRPKYD